MPLTFLHTGDVHLGAPFKHLGSRAPEQRKQLRTTFKQVVDLAIERDVDLFLCAGDLFDSNTVSDTDVAFARTELERLEKAHIPLVLIGGTHDCLADVAVLKREGVLNDLQNVTLLTPEQPQLVFEDLGVTVSGTSNTTNKSRTSPLQDFPTEANTPLHIGMIHGSLAIPGKHAENDMPFTTEEIEATGLDYLGVGHWHSLNDISSEHVTAYYAGSPEAIDFGEHRAGYVIIGTLEEGAKPEIEPVRVGMRTFDRKEIDVTGYTTTIDIIKKIQCDADGQCAMEVILSGVKRPDLTLDVSVLEEELSEHFFQILVKDKTTVSLDDIDEASIPEQLVYGQFVRRMKQQLQEAETEEQRKVVETALQIGIAHLAGKDD